MNFNHSSLPSCDGLWIRGGLEERTQGVTLKLEKNKSSSLRSKLWLSFAIVAIVTISAAWILIGNLDSAFTDLNMTETLNAAAPAHAGVLSDSPGKPVQRFRTIIFVSSAVIIIALAVAGFYLSRTVLQPIERTTIAAKKIARGRLDKMIPIHSHDEIGDLGEQINDIAMNAQEILLYMWNMSGQLSEFLANASNSLNSGRKEISPKDVLEQIAYAENALKEMRATIEGFGLYGVELDRDKVVESDHVS